MVTGYFAFSHLCTELNGKLVKFAIATKTAKAISTAHTHTSGGYRVDYGKVTTFTGYPTNISNLIACVPVGCYTEADSSYAQMLSVIVSGSDYIVRGTTNNANENAVARILVIYQ